MRSGTAVSHVGRLRASTAGYDRPFDDVLVDLGTAMVMSSDPHVGDGPRCPDGGSLDDAASVRTAELMQER